MLDSYSDSQPRQNALITRASKNQKWVNSSAATAIAKHCVEIGFLTQSAVAEGDSTGRRALAIRIRQTGPYGRGDGDG